MKFRQTFRVSRQSFHVKLLTKAGLGTILSHSITGGSPDLFVCSVFLRNSRRTAHDVRSVDGSKPSNDRLKILAPDPHPIGRKLQARSI